jgi:hypothetical protein
MTLQTGIERRDSFRIDMKASVTLTDRVDDMVDPGEYFRELHAVSMMSEFQALEQELIPLTDRIRDLAALKSIELIRKQLSVLAKMQINRNMQKQALHTQTVNVSEGGCAFESDEMRKVGDQVAVALVFQPSYFALFTFATVIDIESTEQKIHLRFDDITERQTQELMKHMFHAQTLTKKQ